MIDYSNQLNEYMKSYKLSNGEIKIDKNALTFINEDYYFEYILKCLFYTYL